MEEMITLINVNLPEGWECDVAMYEDIAAYKLSIFKNEHTYTRNISLAVRFRLKNKDTRGNTLNNILAEFEEWKREYEFDEYIAEMVEDSNPNEGEV